MKKHCIGFVMLFFAALIFSSCNGNSNLTAKEGEPAGGFLWENNFSEITITGYQGASNDITIPEKINGKPVTKIAENAFSGFSALNSVKIPDSVKAIGFSAFSGCHYLTRVEIGNGVTSIGDYAFPNCSSLTSITVSKDNAAYHSSGNCLIETASKTLIVGCKNSVIPTDGSVTTIGEGAFCNCSSLTSIVISDSVTSIDHYAFYGCSSLTSIVIPDSVTAISSSAFEGCNSLTDIVIPDSVTFIGEFVFVGCSDLTSITYTGTIAQWNQIRKGIGWSEHSVNYTIHCTDGDISK